MATTATMRWWDIFFCFTDSCHPIGTIFWGTGCSWIPPSSTELFFQSFLAASKENIGDVGAAIEELVSRLQNMYCRSQSTIPHSEHTMWVNFRQQSHLLLYDAVQSLVARYRSAIVDKGLLRYLQVSPVAAKSSMRFQQDLEPTLDLWQFWHVLQVAIESHWIPLV